MPAMFPLAEVKGCGGGQNYWASSFVCLFAIRAINIAYLDITALMDPFKSSAL